MGKRNSERFRVTGNNGIYHGLAHDPKAGGGCKERQPPGGFSESELMDAAQKLPDNLLNLAMLRGNEYAWPPEYVPHVITAARKLNFAVLGGQLQFRLVDATCELYWIDFGADEKQKTETWQQFVRRAAEECRQRFLDTIEKYDLVREGLENFSFLQEHHENGVNLEQYACFVIDIVDESEFSELQSKRNKKA